MRYRNTLILLVVLAALAAYVFIVEKPFAPQATPEDDYPTPIPSVLVFAADQATVVRLSRRDTEQLTELRLGDDGIWRITAPVEEEADAPQVTRLVDTLASLRPSRVLTGTAESLADYELDPPLLRADVKLSSGEAVWVALGATNPSSSGRYGRVSGDERVFLMPYYVGSDIERYLNAPPVKPTATPETTATPEPVEIPEAAQTPTPSE